MEASLKGAETTIRQYEEKMAIRVAREASHEALEKLRAENKTLREDLSATQTTLKQLKADHIIVTKQATKLQGENINLMKLNESMNERFSRTKADLEDQCKALKEELEQLQLHCMVLQEEREQPTRVAVSGSSSISSKYDHV